MASAWRYAVAVGSFIVSATAQTSVPLMASIFSPKTNVLSGGGNSNATLFRFGAQPLHYVSDNRTMYVVGTYAASSERIMAPNFTAPSFAPNPDLWWSHDGGKNWARPRTLPPDVLATVMSTATIVRSPAGGSMLCMLGGLSKCADGSWTSSSRMRCTADTGLSWQSLPDLSIPVAGATFVQGPFGAWLYGGVTLPPCSAANIDLDHRTADVVRALMVSPAPANPPVPWNGGMQQIIWDATGENILQWRRSVVFNTPPGLVLHPSVAFSYERKSLYVTGGVKLADAQELIPLLSTGAELAPVDLWNKDLWRLTFKNFTDNQQSTEDCLNSEQWTQLPQVPSYPIYISEPSAILKEFLTDGRAWLEYLPQYQDPAARPERFPGTSADPALGFVTPERVYFSAYGIGGWDLLPPLIQPMSQLGVDESVRMRALTIFPLDDDVPFIAERFGHLPNSFGIAGVVVGLTWSDRASLLGRNTKVYPAYPCLPAPCGISQGLFSFGCTDTPWDAECSSCDMSPACVPGETFEVAACGETFTLLGNPAATLCAPCTACIRPEVLAIRCNVVNNTVCRFGDEETDRNLLGSRSGMVLQGTTAEAGAATALILLLVCLVASVVRWSGGKHGRATLQRLQGTSLSLFPCVKEPVSKSAQHGAMLLLSTLLASGSLMLQAIFAAAMMQAPQVLQLHSYMMWVVPAVGLFANAMFVASCLRRGLTLSTRQAVLSLLHPRTVVICLLRMIREAGKGVDTGTSLPLGQCVRWLKFYVLGFEVVTSVECWAALLLYLPQDPAASAQAGFARSAIAVAAVLTGVVTVAFSVHVTQLATTRQLIMSLSTGGATTRAQHEQQQQAGFVQDRSLPQGKSKGDSQSTFAPAPGAGIVVVSPLAASATAPSAAQGGPAPSRSTRVAGMQSAPVPGSTTEGQIVTEALRSNKPPALVFANAVVSNVNIASQSSADTDGQSSDDSSDRAFFSRAVPAEPTAPGLPLGVGISEGGTFGADGVGRYSVASSSALRESVQLEESREGGGAELSQQDVTLLAAMFAQQLEQSRQQGRSAEQQAQIQQALARMQLLIASRESGGAGMRPSGNVSVQYGSGGSSEGSRSHSEHDDSLSQTGTASDPL